jgi:hypothetical protein
LAFGADLADAFLALPAGFGEEEVSLRWKAFQSVAAKMPAAVAIARAFLGFFSV